MICLFHKIFSSQTSSQLTVHIVSITVNEYGKAYRNYTVGNKYYSGNAIRTALVACMDKQRKAYRNLIEKSRGNKSLGRS